jgi:hypothetical protein
MAVGLIIGIDADPTQEQFRQLLDSAIIEPEGFTFEAVALSPEEAADRNQLREYYKAACAKQGWIEGIALANDLEFADLVVAGGRLVVVQPPVGRSGEETAGSAPPPADASVTISDIMAMKRRGDADGLIGALRHSDLAVRAEAAISLGGLGDRSAVEPLIAVLRGDSDPYVRSLAAGALGDLGDARARDALLGSLGDDTMDVAAAAAKALSLLR